MLTKAYLFAPVCEIIVMDQEAKAPTDSDWQFADIYLFSNGQHQTPPRKYHLDSDDLNSWQQTLTKIAHFHYGSIFSSIDLYTTEGERILTPMQVTPGGTYVAVPPQDTFIPAGYEDYLLKATRSREKRQSKLKNSSLGPQPGDEINIKQENSELDAKEERELNILIEEREITATSTNANLCPLTNLQLKVLAKNNIDALKKPENKTSFSKNPPIIRKNSMLSAHETTRRTSFRSKDSVPKKNLKVNTLSAINGRSAVIGSSNNAIRPKSKFLSRTNRNTNKETASVLSNDAKIEENEQLHRIMSSREKNLSIESKILENIVDDKELIEVKNNDSEMTPVPLERDKSGSVFTKQTTLSSIMPLLPIEESKTSALNKDETTSTVINNIVENINKPDFKPMTSKITSKHENKTNVVDVSLPPKSKVDTAMFRNESPVDNFVAVIDKGDIVNLHLKIEVRKAEGIMNGRCEKNSIELHCLTEKSSQINVEQMFVESSAKACNVENNLTPEKQSSKIVVLNDCACCSYFNDFLDKINTTGVSLEDNKYVLLLPSPKFGYNNGRVSVDQNPVKKVYGSTSLLDTAVKKVEITSTKEVNGVPEDDKNMNNLAMYSKVYTSNIEEPSSKQLPKFNNPNFSSDEIRGTELESTIIGKSIVNTVTVDNNAQTEWSCLLLEARRHEDGRYSFHLPPLHVLKYYGFN